MKHGINSRVNKSQRTKDYRGGLLSERSAQASHLWDMGAIRWTLKKLMSTLFLLPVGTGASL